MRAQLFAHRRPDRHQHASVVAIVAFASALAACAPFDLPAERLSKGDVTLYTEVPVTFSTELLDEMMRYRRAVDAELGTSSSESSAIEYALLGDDGAVRDACSRLPGASACAFGEYAATTAPLHLHELVHVFTHVRGSPHPFLFEGFAEVFGGSPGDILVAHDLPLTRILSSTPLLSSGASDGYAGSASFTSFLIDTFGMHAVMRFYECDDGGNDDLDSLDATARDTLGVSLSEAHAAWTALPPEPRYTITRNTYACSGPEADLTSSNVVRLVRGASRTVSQGGAVRTFSVNTPSTLVVHAEGTSVGVLIGSCDRRPNVLGEHTSTSSLDASAPIEPGRYFVWMTSQFESPQDSVLEGLLQISVEPR